MKTLSHGEELQTRSLSGHYAYMLRDSERWRYTYNSAEAIEEVPESERVLDVASVVSLLCWRYIVGDRTLVTGLQRQPWFSSVTNEETRFFEVPPFGNRQVTSEAVIAHIFDELVKEIRSAVATADHVVILLSGGMDSRIVAGIVRHLEEQGDLAVPVEGFTWGLPDCRDVQYARQICDLFGWSWRHVPFDTDDLRRNFEIVTNELGGEVDPKHLHQIPELRNYGEGTRVLAGSYGNSIGRAEYSSTPLGELAALEPTDRSAFLTEDAWKLAETEFRRETAAFRARYPQLDEQAHRELERQAHYMRRMLSHPLGLINRTAHLTQAFCSPEIFLYVFSLPRRMRDDRIYAGILDRIAPRLTEIPWARTGRPFTSPSGDPVDGFRKENHRYSYILKTELADFIADALFDGTLESLGVFNMGQIEFMYREWRAEEPMHETELSTQLSNLAAISKLARKHKLRGPESLQGRQQGLTWRQAKARASSLVRRKSRSVRLKYGQTR